MANEAADTQRDRQQVEEKLVRLVTELRRQGLRVTAQRLAIARIVFENIKEHPSFMQILEKVRETMPSVSPSTVYNNLQLLEKLGLIKSFDVAGETRYDNTDPHINIVCLDTGRVFDAEDESREVVQRVKKLLGGDARVYEVVVYAFCSNEEQSAAREASGPG
ncbi:MAG TPA: transcriptional repressor [Pyrodictium delaneyi]|uniref:Transcriptional repressor n=1 Tax=Pyrodictium delaneyi TaxID=1273541 RepID=A0A832ZU71_9CREN|nr:transcriptional repressor [Pyrodictium delaneyi]